MAVRPAHVIPLVLLSVALGSGCGGPKVNETKPLAEIRTEAQKMTSRELRRVADAYAEAVVDKRKAVDKLRDRLENLAPEEIVNQGAATLKTDADAVATSISALDQRHALYLELLQTKVDETKPRAQIETEIAAMPLERVRTAAKAYHAAILKKRAEAGDLAHRLDKMPPAEKTGTEAAKTARRITALQAADGALCERLALYVKHLREQGADTTDLSLP